MVILRSPKIQLIPYSPQYWQYIAKWFYEVEYQDMWRHHSKALTQTECENYPNVIGGEVFLLTIVGTDKIAGFVQLIPDCKTNRGFYLGMVIDKEYQHQHLTVDILQLIFDYAFNRRGYRKAILEVCEDNATLNKLLTKWGFLKEGTFIGEAFIDGEYVNEIRYCMMASYFNKKFKSIVDEWKKG